MSDDAAHARVGGAPDGALWRFSLDFYARPGVAETCLALQDRHGKDVTIVLYAIWLGLSGRGRLTEAMLAAIETDIAPWRSGTIEPIRALRRRTKGPAETADLYRTLQKAELEAERVAQERLEASAPPIHATGDAARRGDAEANLALYLGISGSTAEASALRDTMRNLP